MKKILVSIIVCLKDEIESIDSCVSGFQNFELPSNTDYEIIFIDGMSTDGTYEKIEKVARFDDKISLIRNKKVFQVFGINKGIEYANGDYILWLGAHAIYPKDYLKILLDTAEESNADYIGGIVETVPWDSSYSASIVQAVSTHIFGVAIIEASSCAKPVVVSNVGGLPEVVENNVSGLVVPPRNPQKTADALEKLILDEKLRVKIGNNGRERVRKMYNWNNNVKQMLEIYGRF